MFGGNGFVGQNVCQAALLMGADVVSVNRSGAPAGRDKVWKDNVRWVQGDIFKPELYAAEVCAGGTCCYYTVVYLHHSRQAGNIFINKPIVTVCEYNSPGSST